MACGTGAAAGCNNLGVLYEKGLGVTQDYERAVQLYDRACDAKYPRACLNLGILQKARGDKGKPPAALPGLGGGA